jgi:hypothetical protein
MPVQGGREARRMLDEAEAMVAEAMVAEAMVARANPGG